MPHESVLDSLASTSTASVPGWGGFRRRHLPDLHACPARSFWARLDHHSGGERVWHRAGERRVSDAMVDVETHEGEALHRFRAAVAQPERPPTTLVAW